MGWRRDEQGMLAAEFSDIEAAVLRELTEQLLVMVESADHRDAAMRRLLPDAYPEDPDASSEFRRLTQHDLTSRKADAARTLVRSVGDGGAIRLGDDDGWEWLRALTDLRLVLASRLGIDGDEDEGDDEGDNDVDDVESLDGEGLDDDPDTGAAEAAFLRDAFEWLGFVQETLVAAMERRG